MSDALPVLVLADLDDTLFQSRRKCPAGREVSPVAFGRTGEALSFATARQRRLFDWLRREGELVPVTARSSEAMARVRLPFTGHAITAFGGVILTPGGGIDADWDTRIRREAAAYRDDLTRLGRLAEEIAARDGGEVRVTVVVDRGIPLYLALKHGRSDGAALARLTGRVVRDERFPRGWRLHLNDNHAAFLPPSLGKEHAVRYFLERLAAPEAVTFGVGDSHGDAPFLALCDYALVPTGSQLGGHLHSVRAYANDP